MHIIHLRINDSATGKPTPARVRITGPDGHHYVPFGRAVDIPLGRNEAVGSQLGIVRERWCYIDGACEIALPAGIPVRVQADKGPEYTPTDETVTLGAGQMALRFAIARWRNMPAEGWVSVDSRCHFLTAHDALLEAEAEGIAVVNLLATPQRFPSIDGTSYPTVPNLTAFSGQVPALERNGHAVVVNTLNVHPILGKVSLLHSHRPVFPLAFGGEETDDWGICDWCVQCHRKHGLTVWVEAFEPVGGINGGEALIAAILGKIDAIEMSSTSRKVPLVPWMYELWNAGILVPLIGGSGKDSNKVVLGGMRTYARIPAARGFEPLETLSWVEAIRAGSSFATAGPFLAFRMEGDRFLTAGTSAHSDGKLEVIQNGEVIATAQGLPAASGNHFQAELNVALPISGWVAARWNAKHGIAHTSPIAVGNATRQPAAIASLQRLIDQTREWVEQHGRYTKPKCREQILARCDEARTKLELAR